MTITITRKVLLVCSVVCFTLAAFGVNFKRVDLKSAGVAFFVASFLA